MGVSCRQQTEITAAPKMCFTLKCRWLGTLPRQVWGLFLSTEETVWCLLLKLVYNQTEEQSLKEKLYLLKDICS